jgi:hypothetical protein
MGFAVALVEALEGYVSAGDDKHTPLLKAVDEFMKDHPPVSVPDTALMMPLPRPMDVDAYKGKYEPKREPVGWDPPADLEGGETH